MHRQSALKVGFITNTIAIAIVVGTFVAGCGTGYPRVSQVGAGSTGQSIALVSLSINDMGGTPQSNELIANRIAETVAAAEKFLARYWRVTPSASFLESPAYQQVPAATHAVLLPPGMKVFGVSRRQLIRAELTPEQAQALARAAGTDYVAVVYAEWDVATGSFVPTSKALAKTVVAVHRASGERVAAERVDGMGEKTLGAFGGVVVDDNSIGEWFTAYERTLEKMALGK